MAYNEKLAERIRKALARHKGTDEIKMFGGLCFTLRGNMCCGIAKEDLMVRVGPKAYERALSMPHARPMNFTGRPMKGFVFVGPKGYKSDKDLAKWVKLGADFVLTLPPKKR